MIWSGITAIGSVLGIVSACFILWDQIFKSSPTAFIVARPYASTYSPQSLFLRVKNRSDRPILISVANGTYTGQFSLAESHETRAIVTALVNGASTYALDGGEQKEFPLLTPSGYKDISADNIIDMKVFWEFAQPVIWRGRRWIKVVITKRNLQVMLRDQAEDEE